MSVSFKSIVSYVKAIHTGTLSTLFCFVIIDAAVYAKKILIIDLKTVNNSIVRLYQNHELCVVITEIIVAFPLIRLRIQYLEICLSWSLYNLIELFNISVDKFYNFRTK